MNKSDLIDAMASESGLSKVDCKRALEALVSSISTSLEDGKKVSLVGFGSWNVSNRKARVGRNPKTGISLEIPAKKVVKFKTGLELANRVK